MRIKNGFLIDRLERFLGKTVEEASQGKRVLDVACGPVSVTSQMKGARTLEGVDPLRYPEWVYSQYERRGFHVHLCRLEDLDAGPYDFILCYNALQHFEDLDAATAALFRLLTPGGRSVIVDYLEIPTDDAHLQCLTKSSMDASFARAGFVLRSEEVLERLPGYVERGGNRPIKLYLGEIDRSAS
jgi:2-polyprenyl-3-methyl-5-hydroxy-6-metoxy-1,4-benzoquinol methylase